MPADFSQMMAARASGAGRLSRWVVWLALALALIVLTSAALLRFAIWPNLHRWQPQIEQRLGQLAGRPVQIGSLSAGFDGWRPWVVATGVRIRDDDGADALVIDRLRAVLSIRAALRGRFGLALLESEAPFLRIERISADRIRVAGFEQRLDGTVDPGLPGWLALQRRVILRGARVEILDRVGGRRTELANIDLVLGSRGRRLRGSLHIPQWATLARGVDAAWELSWPPFGAPLDWRQWRGEVWAGIRGADLAALLAGARSWFDDTALAASLDRLHVETGWAGVRFWTFFEPDVARRTVLKFAADGLKADIGGQAIPLSGLRLDARSSHDAAGRTTVVFEHLAFEDDRAQRFDALASEPMVRLDAHGQPLAARLALGEFDAASVLTWVRRFPLPVAVRGLLDPLQVDGRVHHASFTWASEAGQPHGEFEADFAGLSFAWNHASVVRAGELRPPGFRNLSGRVRADLNGGRAELQGRDLQLVFPGLFADPVLPLQQLDARVAWTIEAPGSAPAAPAVTVRIESMRFANADAAGELAGTWHSAGDGPGIIDLGARLERADARRTARYLPLTVPAEVRQWVQDAIRSGHSDDVRLVLRGDLAGFPWRDPAAGIFRVDARVAGVGLAWAPDWPMIDRIDGSLRFERAGMQVEARTGALWRIGLDPVHARIDDFDRPLLQVQGGATGPAADLLRFLKESPLRAQLGGVDMDVELRGAATLQLGLAIPLDTPHDARARGSVRWSGNEIDFGSRLPRFEQWSGRLEFTENAVTLHDMSARVLGGTLRIGGAADARGRLHLDLQGDASTAELLRWRLAAINGSLAARMEHRLGGPITFTARFDQDSAGSSFELTTDLATVHSSLPQPFDKPEGERWPVHLAVKTTPAGGESLDLALADRARLIVEHDARAGSERRRRGVLAVGVPAVLPAAGIAAHIRVSVLDLDAWAALFESDPETTVAGDIDGFEALAGQFRQALPTLDVVAQTFIAGGRKLGSLHLQAENDASRPGEGRGVDASRMPPASRWRLRQLQLEQPAGRFDATGVWQARQGDIPPVSDLQFSLTVRNGGELLDLFGYPEVLRGGAGELSGRIAWRGSPVHLDTRSLSGGIALTLGRGQFLKSDPGMAKLIGVLNLQSLQRRLVFDFRDLFAEGFAFDEISASAQIVDGVAAMDDFRMKGVVAQVAIRGQIDLAAETQSLVVQVRPEFDARLASLAYAALANPVLGLGSFVAQTVLREPLQQMFGHEYDVTGAWADPQVTRRERPRPAEPVSGDVGGANAGSDAGSGAGMPSPSSTGPSVPGIRPSP